jgi:ribosome-binding factor A
MGVGMHSKRQKRVADQLREILSELLTTEVRDPRLEGVTVMEVEVDRELMYATVYVSSLAGDDARDSVVDALESARGFLRRELGKRMRLMRTPELRFSWDETMAYGDRIERLLDSLEPSKHEPDDADDAAD